MSIRSIPLIQVKPDLRDSVRMAVHEIERYLCLFHPPEVVKQKLAAQAIAGQWLSRIKGFHDNEDFLHLVRDFVSYLLSEGQRSRIADQLGWYFGGFMPSYGAACTLMEMAVEGQSWEPLAAFMHSQSYGNARQYVEQFDWKAAQTKANAEIKAWTAIVQEHDKSLQAAAWGEPVLLAQAQPAYDPVRPGIPANDPYMPKPKPPLRVIPGGAGAAAAESGAVAVEGLGSRLAGGLLRLASVPLQVVILALTPSTLGDGTLKDHHLTAQSTTLNVPLVQAKPDAQVDTTNNDCKPQRETNQKNGAECENDGYVLMEKSLQYKRLINPPKGKGLDGLFEKNLPFEQPHPIPENVTQPKPGKLVFIPPDKKPPHSDYDYAGSPKRATYPKFVVFEAKHIAKSFGEKDIEGIKKEAKNRLGKTCDGLQMSEPWTEERIPQAIKRGYPGKSNKNTRTNKLNEIVFSRYSRRIFICLPGSVGSGNKIFVFIDVVSAGLDLESTPAKPRAPQKTPSSSENY